MGCCGSKKYEMNDEISKGGLDQEFSGISYSADKDGVNFEKFQFST